MASHLDVQRFAMVKLNNSNYFQWKFSIEMVLLKDGLWKTIEEERPETITEEWSRANNSARATIALSVEPELHELIRECDCAKSIWNKIKTHFERVGLSTKVFLRRKLADLKLEGSASMDIYINNVMEIVRRLRSAGDKITDLDVISTILCGLPESYDGLIMALESKNENDLNLEYVRMKLIDESQRRNQKLSSQNVLNSQYYSRNEERKNERKCYECGRSGHIKRYCPRINRASRYELDKKPNYDIKTDHNSEDTAYRADCSIETNSFFSFSANKVPDEQNILTNQKWTIDSGANFHMCHDKTNFQKYEEFDNENTIQVANGVNIKALGKGKIDLILNQNERNIIITLKDVIYAPDLAVNLMSVNQICEQGYTVKFKNDMCLITNNNDCISITKVNGLYTAELSINESCKEKSYRACIHEWHQILGHRSLEKIKVMSKESMTNNLIIKPCNHSDGCSACNEASMTQIPFKRVTHKQTSEPFQLIHSDLCGPITPMTKGGGNYFLTLTDDWSRYCQVSIIKYKSDTTREIKKYMEHYYNRFKHYPSYFRSDGGGEYENAELNDYLDSIGTKHQLSVPFSPQQNGLSERLNRTLLKMAKTMMNEAKIPKTFWGELVSTSCYLYNRNVHTYTGCTPYERWEDRIPNLKHLRVIGQKVHYWTPKQNRSKLDNSGKTGMLVGYGDRQKAYRIWDAELGKIVFSRTICPLENSTSSLSQNDWEPEQDKDEYIIELKTQAPSTAMHSPENQPRRSDRSNKGVPPIRYRQ